MKWHFNPQHPHELSASYRVQPSDIDGLNHVNNKVYLAWMEALAWQHSLAVGINSETHQSLGKIMVVVEHKLNYHHAALLDDALILKTWLSSDEKIIGCCQRKRYYAIHRIADNKKLFSGHTLWACMNLKTQRACKLPDAFITPYFTPKNAEK